MTTNERPTDADIRTRVEEIAVEVYVDITDPKEPLTELIERVRAGIRDEHEQMTGLYQEFETELDQFQTLLAGQPSRPERTA